MSQPVNAPISQKPPRNYGIDLLRIVAMYLIIICHLQQHGGIINSAENASGVINNTVWLIQTIVCGAVNMYALISGYVGYTSKFKPSKMLSLQLKTSFWALIITALFAIFPQPNQAVGINNWISALFPFINEMYWYLSAYFGLLIFKPLLDTAIKGITEKTFYVFIVCVVLYFTITKRIQSVGILGGYNMLWLIILYIIGGCLNRFNLASKLPNWLLCLCLLSTIITTWIGRELKIYSYTSPTELFMAISMVLLFSKIKINSSFIKKLISVVSASTLGVYVIHENPLIRTRFIVNKVTYMVQMPFYLMTVNLLVTALIIFTLCAVLDIIREKLFKLIKINRLYNIIDTFYDKLMLK